MSESAPGSKYGKYIVKNPRIEVLPNEPNSKGVAGSHVYMSAPQVSESPIHLILNWIYQVPDPDPYVERHVHPFDEVLFFIGTNPDDLTDLGATATIQLGDETHTIDSTASVFIPKGLWHCPINYQSVDRPHAFIALTLDGRYTDGDYVSPDEAPELRADTPEVSA